MGDIIKSVHHTSSNEVILHQTLTSIPSMNLKENHFAPSLFPSLMEGESASWGRELSTRAWGWLPGVPDEAESPSL